MGKGSGMSYYKLLLAIILLLLVLIFIFQNQQDVTIRFLAWEHTTDRGFMVLIVSLAGILIGWLARGQLAARSKR